MQKNDQMLNKISKIHSEDENQLLIIKSENRRMLIEAPAGSGKTKTLISTIAYNIASGLIPNTKKILALTFSVNAAYKIKKEVIEQLPILFDEDKSFEQLVSKNIWVSNYHGFCRKILGLYGFKLSSILNSLNEFSVIDDKKIPTEITLTDEEKNTINNIINSGQEQNAAGRCGHRAALQRAALQRLLARAQGVQCGERRPRAVLR